MPRFAAFLRGVMPTNCKMPALRAAFEAAGFSDVTTVLGSGNVVFTTRSAATGTLERRAEAAIQKRLGRTFLTIIRPLDELRALLDADPFGGVRLKPGAKRIVTFLRRPATTNVALPIERDGVRIHSMTRAEVFTSYVRTPKGPVFMTLLQRTFGEEQTTRTWDTVARVARAP